MSGTSGRLERIRTSHNVARGALAGLKERGEAIRADRRLSAEGKRERLAAEVERTRTALRTVQSGVDGEVRQLRERLAKERARHAPASVTGTQEQLLYEQRLANQLTTLRRRFDAGALRGQDLRRLLQDAETAGDPVGLAAIAEILPELQGATSQRGHGDAIARRLAFELNDVQRELQDVQERLKSPAVRTLEAEEQELETALRELDNDRRTFTLDLATAALSGDYYAGEADHPLNSFTVAKRAAQAGMPLEYEPLGGGPPRSAAISWDTVFRDSPRTRAERLQRPTETNETETVPSAPAAAEPAEVPAGPFRAPSWGEAFGEGAGEAA